ncbi:MAG TPA: hypothetical protein VG228_00240 [Solirubrobacteraceae bacterium]|nr:hypothetical protein [Solirubrobacteraceae bacterium]
MHRLVETGRAARMCAALAGVLVVLGAVVYATRRSVSGRDPVIAPGATV